MVITLDLRWLCQVRMSLLFDASTPSSKLTVVHSLCNWLFAGDGTRFAAGAPLNRAQSTDAGQVQVYDI